MRAVLGLTVLEFPNAYSKDADDAFEKGLKAYTRCSPPTLLPSAPLASSLSHCQQTPPGLAGGVCRRKGGGRRLAPQGVPLRGRPRLSFCLAPHAPYSVSDSSFKRAAALAERLHLPLHTHLHETRDEIAQSLKEHGMRPLERLRRLGLLGPRLLAVHAVHLEAQEVSQLAACGASVVHCPTSNLKHGSGIASLAALLEAGVNVGLGTDGAASNSRFDLFEEMRLAALLAKGSTQRASVADAHRVLEMATLGGARALGLEEEIGSLEAGKAADLCAVDLGVLHLSPCYNPVSHLVYAAGGNDVSHTWVEGKARLKEGRLVDVDADAWATLATAWRGEIQQNERQ
jgi:5-methylthioadenosine/S-adenosylhomocysteine deaminase